MSSDDDNLTWYYKTSQFPDPCLRNRDKIGIAPNAKYMTHDNMIHKLTKLKNIVRKEFDDGKQVIALYLIYTIDNQTNWIYQENENVLYFKYVGSDIKNVKFKFIGFNCLEFS